MDYLIVGFIFFIVFFIRFADMFVICLNLLIKGLLAPVNLILSLLGLKQLAFKGISLPSKAGRKGRSGRGGFWGGGGFGGGGGSFGGGGSSGRF